MVGCFDSGVDVLREKKRGLREKQQKTVLLPFTGTREHFPRGTEDTPIFDETFS